MSVVQLIHELSVTNDVLEVSQSIAALQDTVSRASLQTTAY